MNLNNNNINFINLNNTNNNFITENKYKTINLKTLIKDNFLLKKLKQNDLAGKNNIFDVNEKNLIKLLNNQKSILNKKNTLPDKIKLNLFTYTICCGRKNIYFERLQKLIKRDLSIENILKIINSHEIIVTILKDKQIIQNDLKANFYDKIKLLNVYSKRENTIIPNELAINTNNNFPDLINSNNFPNNLNTNQKNKIRRKVQQ